MIKGRIVVPLNRTVGLKGLSQWADLLDCGRGRAHVQPTHRSNLNLHTALIYEPPDAKPQEFTKNQVRNTIALDTQFQM